MSTEAIPTIKQSAPGIWAALPKQPKQERCRQNFGHSKPRRSFFWIVESQGVICQICMNVRETRKALEECRKAGNNGNGGLLGKSGKRNRSTLAPVIQGAVLAKRANGANKAQIARDLKISHNTVDKILDETEFDAQIAEGRSKAVGLIPEALGGLKVAFAKGDGATSCRFLEGMNVLGVQNDRPGKPDSDIHLMQSIQMLIRPETPVITVEAQTVEPSSK